MGEGGLSSEERKKRGRRVRPEKQQQSRAEQSRAGAVFYVSVIPTSVARQVALSCPDTLVGITLTQNTAPALLFVWKWLGGQCGTLLGLLLGGSGRGASDGDRSWGRLFGGHN